ncbi:MAG: TRAP transporter small permease [Clostridiales bacterium]|nr:TRAP transporter small permease [Clostridiales bacterium]
MTQIKKVIDAILKWASIILLAVTSVLVVWQVIARYLLKMPSSWSEIAVTYGFVCLGMLCGAYVFGQSDHMNMQFIRNRFPRKVQIVVQMFTELMTAFLAAAVMGYGGYQLAVAAMTQIDPSLHIPMGYIYMVIPIAGVCMIFYFVYIEMRLIQELIGKKKPETDLPSDAQ